jgi:putative hydrolase of the HAD superfamily
MIFFDLDGTLLDDDAEVQAAIAGFYERFREELPADRTAFFAQWKELSERWFNRYLAREIGFQEQRRGRMRELFPGIDYAEADDRYEVFLAGYEQNWRLFPDVQPALAALPGKPLGIITNGDPRQQRLKLERMGIADRFSIVVISGEVGVAKPEPGIFAEACRRAGEAPGLCWYVGDRLETDPVAAVVAGLHGVWINRDPARPADPRVPTIRSLEEMPALT